MRFPSLTVLSFVVSTSTFVPIANRHNVRNPFGTRPLNTALFSSNESNGSESTTPARKPNRTFNFDPAKYRMDPVIQEAAKTSGTNPVVVNPGAPKTVDASPPVINVEASKAIEKAPVVNKPEPVANKPETPKPVDTTASEIKTVVKKPETPKPVDTTAAEIKPVTPTTANNTSDLMIPDMSNEPMTPIDNEESALNFASAPLIIVPIVALAAGRDALAKTSAQRDQIQKQIDKLESKKKEIPSVDPDGVTVAVVRSQNRWNTNFTPLLRVSKTNSSSLPCRDSLELQLQL